jgi:hypothetical protein
MTEKENSLLKDKHILICLDEENHTTNKNLDYLKQNFCGIVITKINDQLISDLVLSLDWIDRIIYLCGNIHKIYDIVKDIKLKTIYIIKELSYDYEEFCEKCLPLGSKFIDIGKVPINIHNVGIYFRKFFDFEDCFNLIKSEHNFQTLTESNKPNNALRKGIYLTKVEESNDGLKFNLLRCSSNLDGGTDNFRNTDNEIITQVNNISQCFFEEKAELNHVLAQIYENNDKGKAKIKAHSDKTKDMPKNALIAFCTFYDNITKNEKIKKSKIDMFDYCYNETSVLTKLCFKLKHCVKDNNLTKKFNITLYPNSVFIIPLSTNRMYTHEIRPSALPFDKINTRMGYVIRCSNTKAIFKDGQTYINDNGSYIKLEKINKGDMTKLRTLYYEENTTDNIINYGSINFSMNEGNTHRPIL